MKKIILLLLTLLSAPAIAEHVSLPTNPNTLISYAKPNIYVIEQNRYFRVKLPEMTKTEPIYFAFQDSTFARNFVPTSHTFSMVNGQAYLSSNLGGTVYKLKGNRLLKMDQSYEHKMQINSEVFVYDNRIFRFGGYGFWSARNFFTYFDLKSKEWEVYSPVNGKRVPPGLFDTNLYQDGENIFLFNGITMDKFDNLKLVKSQDIWHFNLSKKHWEKKGKSALFFGNNTKNFQDKHFYFAFTEERRILRINFTNFTYETFQNESVSTKIYEGFKPIVYNKRLFYFSYNHSTQQVDLTSIPLADFLGEPQSSNSFLEMDIWETYQTPILVFAALVLLGLLAFLFIRYKPQIARKITDKDGILYLGKAAINFDETELKVIRYLLKNDVVPNSELLGLVEQKGVHFSHNIRLKNDLLNQLNLKLKAILQVDVNFIIFKKSNIDSRLKVYRLNKQYFKVSEAFLNS